ncbi:MAG: GAF domain-containing protein [Fimbriimonas sp.]
MESKSTLGLRELAPLIALVAKGENVSSAIEKLCRSALDVTPSRHVILAVLNDELGVMEIRHGAGDDFVRLAESGDLLLDIGREDGIVGSVAATGRGFRTGNVSEVSAYRQMFASTRSEMAIPIRDRHGRVRAVLNAESDLEDAYSDDDLQTVQVLGDLIAILLERREQGNREDALIEIGSALDSVLTEEALIDRVIHIAENTLSFQACSVFVLEPTTDQFVLRGTSGRLRGQVGQISYGRSEGFTGWVADKGETVLVHDPDNDPRWLGKYVEFPGETVVSYLAVPIVVRNKSIGVIRVLRRRTNNAFLDNRFTEDDRRLLEAIAEQVAAGLENLRNFEKIIRSERMIAWGELSAKSSHMIGNRVFALKGDINEMKHLLNSPEMDVKEFTSLQRSLSINVQRIEEILRDFRDFVSATQVQRQAADLNQLVDQTVHEVFPKRTEVALETHYDPTLPLIEFDPQKLVRAVSELIENALNHMSTGTLRVSTELVASATYPQTRASRFKRFAKIEVEDSGPGIEEDQKGRIFQPFFSKRVKGMGLGLSIVKGILDAHGGEVFEIGEWGHGARFVLLLPLIDML